MEHTGERYTTARRMLLERTADRTRPWVSEPEVSDDAVRTATGRGWDEWCDAIDAWPDRVDGHSAIAAYVEAEFDISGWWAQTVTVGYERITGLRLPYQMSDGTFTANKSKTITVDAETIRDMLIQPSEHADLFPGHKTELRSQPGTKSIRIAIGGGTALFGVAAKDNGRCTVSIAHEKLTNVDDVEWWRFYWEEWLTALDEA